jgi:EmrB/QacA subfamily drug resistance transporter
MPHAPDWSAADYAAHAPFVPALGGPVLALLDPRPGDHILDLGCGDGALTRRIAAAGASVVGIDASPDMVRAARAAGTDTACMDAARLAFAAAFDAVFSNAALHWMPEPEPVLAGVARALRPGGRFVGEMGGHGNVAAIVTALRAVRRARGLPPGGPAWFFPTAAEYAALLAAHGFEVERIDLIPRPTPLPTGIAGWLATFALPFMTHLQEAERPGFVAEVEALLAPALRDRGGCWVADYVRLRFRARLGRAPACSRRMDKGERLIALIVAAALFMQNLDSTVIATALPAIARGFGEDPVHMNVALTGYLFALSLFVPASGWVADRFGTRRVFALAILVFTLGSIMCGQSGTLPALVASRVVQGAGGAMMLPVGRLVLLRTVPKSRLVGAMAWVTMPALVGPVIGPPVGGFIVTYASWPWIFYVNVPVGLLGMALVYRFVPDLRAEDPGRFDLPGLVLSGAALAGFMALLELAGRGLIPGTWLAAIAGITVAAAIAYALHARHMPRPLLDIGLLRLPSFGVSVLAGSLFRVGVGAIPFLLPLMIQIGFGRNALQSGLLTFMSAVGAIISKPAVRPLLRLFGFRHMLAVNGVVSGLLIAATAALRPSWPVWAICALLLVAGFLRSVQFTSFNTVAYAEVPPHRMSAATTLYSALQQVSLTVGIPISAFVLHATRAASGHAAPTVEDFATAFLVIGAISTLAGPAALLMPRSAGAEMSGRSTPAREADNAEPDRSAVPGEPEP